MMPIAMDPTNDWTLDTNAIIRANGGSSVPRGLVESIGKRAFLCWSSAVAQEYQVRGAMNLRQVTQEEDYDTRAVRGIRRILHVRCLDYATALDECQ